MSDKIDNHCVQVSVPGETHSLALVRKIVTHLASDAGFPEEEVDKIEIAVDEACTNAMEHAYRSMSPKPHVQVRIESRDDVFIVDIIDQGAKFDYASYVPPKFPDHWDSGHTRGVGLYLIHQCVDETLYETLPDNANRLRLVKRLNSH